MKDTFDRIIKGGLAICPRSINRLDIGIEGGKIAKMASDLQDSDAREVIDATGKYILPGLIDVHVHPVYVDTIEDCSILGAFGGITTMIHYAYARPGMELADTVKEFIDEGKKISCTDFAIHGAMFDPENQIKDTPKCFDLRCS